MTTCPKCGAQFADGTKFCEACGAQIPEAEVVTAENVQQPAGKKNAKFIKLGAIVAIAVVAVVVLCSLIFGGGKINGIFFTEGGDLFYSELPGFKPFEVGENAAGAFFSKDGKKMFYGVYEDNQLDLYYRYTNKPKKEGVKIASNVSDVEINEAGNLITYIKEGDLYQHNLKESNKVAKEVQEFWTSENGKKVVYADNECNLYLKNGKKDAQKIKGDVAYVEYISNDLSTIYFRNIEGDFYLKKGNKDANKIDSDVSEVYAIYETGEVYYEIAEETEEKKNDGTTAKKTEYTLKYYDGKEKKEIADEYDVEDWAIDKAVLVYCVEEEVDLSKLKPGEEPPKPNVDWFLVIGKEKSEIKTDDVNSVEISVDGTMALIEADADDEGYGTVYTAKITKKEMKNPEKYDEEVYSSSFINEDNDIVCTKDRKEKKYKYSENSTQEYTYYEYSLYMNKKLVADDVYGYRYFEESDLLVYFVDRDMAKNTATVNVFNGKKSVKLGDDIYLSTVSETLGGDVVFIKDYNSEKARGMLCTFNGKKVKELKDDVQSVSVAGGYEEMREEKYDVCRAVSFKKPQVEEAK